MKLPGWADPRKWSPIEWGIFFTLELPILICMFGPFIK